MLKVFCEKVGGLCSFKHIFDKSVQLPTWCCLDFQNCNRKGNSASPCSLCLTSDTYPWKHHIVWECRLRREAYVFIPDQMLRNVSHYQMCAWVCLQMPPLLYLESLLRPQTEKISLLSSDWNFDSWTASVITS